MTFTKQQDVKNIICIWAHEDCEIAKELLRMHVDGRIIEPKIFTRASIRQAKKMTNDPEEPKNYTLKFYQKYGTQEIWVSGLTVGPKTESSEATVACLKMMGFGVSAEEVYSTGVAEKKIFKK